MRAGLLTLERLTETPLPAAILNEIDRLYPTLDPVRRGHELMRRQITAMVEDVIVTSKANLERIAPQSADEVRRAGETIVALFRCHA